MCDEDWKPIPGFGGRYEASSLGRVRRVDGFVMRQQHTADGYLCVGLWSDGRTSMVRTHRLVALAFIGEPPPGKPNVNHIDFKKTHNVPANLEWVSQGENVRHSGAAGRLRTPVLVGSANGRSKLTAEQVSEIRRLRGVVGQRQLARRFGVSKTAIRFVQQGRNWREFPTPRSAR